MTIWRSPTETGASEAGALDKYEGPKVLEAEVTHLSNGGFAIVQAAATTKYHEWETNAATGPRRADGTFEITKVNDGHPIYKVHVDVFDANGILTRTFDVAAPGDQSIPLGSNWDEIKNIDVVSHDGSFSVVYMDMIETFTNDGAQLKTVQVSGVDRSDTIRGHDSVKIGLNDGSFLVGGMKHETESLASYEIKSIFDPFGVFHDLDITKTQDVGLARYDANGEVVYDEVFIGQASGNAGAAVLKDMAELGNGSTAIAYVDDEGKTGFAIISADGTMTEHVQFIGSDPRLVPDVESFVFQYDAGVAVVAGQYTNTGLYKEPVTVPDGGITPSGNTLQAKGYLADGRNVDIALEGASGLSYTIEDSRTGTIQGDGGDNEITAGNGPTTVMGFSGDDTLKAAGAGDTLDGGFDDDLLLGNYGDDVLLGGHGIDYLYGSNGHDKLDGGAHNDVISGGAGNDTVSGGHGSDEMNGNAGIDWLDNTFSNSRYTVDLKTGVTNVSGETAINFENVKTGNGNDVVWGTDTGETNGANTIHAGGGADRLIGRDGDDILYGETGNDVLDGGADNDALYGGMGVDWLLGRGGNDYLSGGNDRDYLYGHDGDDTIEGGAGADYMVGGAGVDWLITTAHTSGYSVDLLRGHTNVAGEVAYGFENVFAGGYADTVMGTHGANVIATSGGNDRVHGRGGNDEILGGDGNDTLNGDTGNDEIDGGAGADVMDGGAGIDWLMNSRYAGNYVIDLVTGDTNVAGEVAYNFENIVTGAGADTVRGTDGDNIIRTFNGADSVFGRSGNDQIETGEGTDYVESGSGDDLIDGGNGQDYLYGGAHNDTIKGGEGDDIISGDEGIDVMDGGAGNDWLQHTFSRSDYNVDLISGETLVAGETAINFENVLTGSGNDKVYGTNGANEIISGGGNDTVYGRDGNDDLKGQSGNDRIFGNDGDDWISGGTGADTMDGGTGNDWLDNSDVNADYRIDLVTGSTNVAGEIATNFENVVTGDGADQIHGTGGANHAYAGEGRDFIDGRAGHDQLEGGGGTDTILGGEGNDYIIGGAGHDLLRGDDGEDFLVGGLDHDDLIGGAGDDLLVGGEGSDTFYFYTGNDGRDAIADFDVDQDTLRLGTVTYDPRDDLSAREGSQGLIVEFGNTEITLAGLGIDDYDDIMMHFG